MHPPNSRGMQAIRPMYTHGNSIKLLSGDKGSKNFFNSFLGVGKILKKSW